MKNIAILLLLFTSLLTLSNAQSPQDDFKLPLNPNTTINNQIASISVQGRALTPEENLALGVLHFLESIEGLSQAWYDYGLGQGTAVNTLDMGSTLLGVTEPPIQNPKPQSITYKDFRKLLQNSILQLETASNQLDLIQLPEDIKLMINIDELAFDANGNNKIDASETVGQVLATMAGATVNDLDLDEAITISFDQGDIHCRTYA